MAYKKDTDYQALIDEAVKLGDYRKAAQYEQSRNEKIQTEGLGYDTTSKYAGWLDDTDYAALGKQQMALGADAKDVLDTYNKRYQKASSTEGMSQYANDEVMQQMWDYISANYNKPTFNFEADNKKPTYESSYSERIDAILDGILNREDFSYDAAKDPLAQQYQKMYEREGNRAMNDTLTSAAANAGGMNSYAITAAQQANNYYAAQAADKMPELFQLAYEMYLQDKQSDIEDLGILQQMDDRQYGRYRDTMNDWYNDRNFAYGQYRDQMGDFQWGKNFDYQVGRDEIADSRYDKEWEYGVSRDELEDSRYENELAYDRVMDMLEAGIMPDASALEKAGLTSSQAAAYIAANTKTISGGRKPASSKDDGKKEEETTTQSTLAEFVTYLNGEIENGATMSEVQSAIANAVAEGDITQAQASILLSEYGR